MQKNRTCTQCKTAFTIVEDDLAFYAKMSPTFAGETFAIPPPTLCPDCRLQHRLVWRNVRSLYRRKCSATGKPIISWISPDKPHKVYKKDEWWSDHWDAHSYGRDVDFNRPFFEQLGELIQEVPWLDLLVDNTFNSDYANFCNNVKDCYLLYASNNDESCFYSSDLWDSRDCIDCVQGFENELCYESVELTSCYACRYSKSCTSCTDCLFCENCKNCQNCFGSVNLIGKQYHFLNERLSKEEYEKRVSALQLNTREGVAKARKLFEAHRIKYPMRSSTLINCEEVSGDHLKNCKNTFYSFDTSGAQDTKWLSLGSTPIKDSQDVTGVESIELIYSSVVCGFSASRVAFSSYVWTGPHDVWYSVLSPSATNCFGVAGLHKGDYCILNKQYSKNAYEALCARLIKHMQKTGEWGQFLPPSCSPFAYNETQAQELFPMKKEEVIARGWQWKEKEQAEYKPATYTPPHEIFAVTDAFINEMLACANCGKNYRIIAQELRFYRTYNIPLPYHCPDCRYAALFAKRNPWKLFTRTCAKCGIQMQTAYSPEKPEIVYCESCYLATVY